MASKEPSKEVKTAPQQPLSIAESGTRANRMLLILAIALFVLSRYYVFFILHPEITDMGWYFEFAVRFADLGQTPYQGDFKVEYPPLALWTIVLPRELDYFRITDLNDVQRVTLFYHHYGYAFRGLMLLCDVASFIIVLLLVGRRYPRLTGYAALFYTFSTGILCHLIYDRLDTGLLLLIILGLYCYVRSFDQAKRTFAWTAAAYTVLGLSFSYKVIPIICVPFLLLADFQAPRRWSRLFFALSGLAAGIAVPFAIQYWASGPGVFDLFGEHAQREIQLESIYSTLMSMISIFGSPLSVKHAHGAFNLSGDWSHVMTIISKVVLLGFFVVLGLWAVLRWSRYSRQDAYWLACFVPPAAVIISNVLSPQYFVWAFPLMLLLAVELFPFQRAPLWIVGVLVIVLAALTTWIFPYHYICTLLNPYGLVPMDKEGPLPPSPVSYIVLGVRNFLYLGLIVWLGVVMFKRIYSAPASLSTKRGEGVIK
jgi:4-amino-4-deoxy-L-arabinose transferase-like glycosyltransferase